MQDDTVRVAVDLVLVVEAPSRQKAWNSSDVSSGRRRTNAKRFSMREP